MEALTVGDEWESSSKATATGEITHLFFAHRQSIALLQASPEVLLMDSTYKTNRYRLPLFCIVGVTPLKRTFHVAFAFLANECRGDFAWALQGLRRLYGLLKPPGTLPATLITDRDRGLLLAIQEVFPTSGHLLCLWHVNKNVVKRCKRLFRSGDAWEGFMSAWNGLLQAPTVADYNVAFAALQAASALGPGSLAYLEETWLSHKTSLCKAWTDGAFHLGHTTTSPVESAHSALKAQLKVSTGDLYAVVTAIALFLQGQHTAVRAASADAKVRLGSDLRVPLFANVTGLVAPIALRTILVQQVRRVQPRTPLPVCTGVFRRTLGLPCAHELQGVLQLGGAMPLAAIHPYWLLDRLGLGESAELPGHPAVLQVREPAVARPRGRPQGTRRNPSQFELPNSPVEPLLQRSTPRDRPEPLF